VRRKNIRRGEKSSSAFTQEKLGKRDFLSYGNQGAKGASLKGGIKQKRKIESVTPSTKKGEGWYPPKE